MFLGVLTCALFSFYHPHRLFAQSDDGFAVLESAYHSVLRDGIFMWGNSSHLAVPVLITQLLEEGVGLKRWVPHCFVLVSINILTLLIGGAWLCRSARGFLAMSVLLSALVGWSDPGDTSQFSYWLCRAGVTVQEYLFTAMLALLCIRRLGRQDGSMWKNLALCAVCFPLALCSNPGLAVVIGVFLIVHAAMPSFASNRPARWVIAVIVLIASYYLVSQARNWYDHSVHISRSLMPVGLSWRPWWPTVLRFLRLNVSYGWPHVVLLGYGMAATVTGCVVLAACFAPRLRRIVSRFTEPSYRAAWALSIAGTAYALMACASVWVQINTNNPTYFILTTFLYLASLGFLAGNAFGRLPFVVQSLLVVGLLGLALWQIENKRPREESAQYRNAQFLLAHLQTNSAAPLLGDFWVACVNSFFDPHRLISSPFDGGIISDVMLPKVLSKKTVLANFIQSSEEFATPDTPPEAFVQRSFVLLRRPTPPGLAARGWHVYSSTPVAEALGRNILDDVTPVVHGPVAFDGGVVSMMAAGSTFAEVLWDVGTMPVGVYILGVRARVSEPTDDTRPLVFYVHDYGIESTYPHLVVQPDKLGTMYKWTFLLIEYKGATVSSRVRLYSLSPSPILISGIGVFAVNLDKAPQTK